MVVLINRRFLKFVAFIITPTLLFLVICFISAQNQVTNATINSVCVPIIMYHNILNSANRTSKFIITPQQFESDLIYLWDHDFTTVVTKDLINYVYNDIPLPKNPIVITFDDGYYNNYSYMYPLLKKYNMKAVLSIIGKSTDLYSAKGVLLNNNYAYATWDELQEMQASGLVEIQNHSYSLHLEAGRNGVSRKRGENYDLYKKKISKDIFMLQSKIKENLGVESIAFTYPFGSVNAESEKLINSLGFLATYSCREGINQITTNPECLHHLKRYNRSGKTSTNAFFAKILKQLK